MGLEYQTLEFKPVVKTKAYDGSEEEHYDLLTQTVNADISTDFQVIMVTEPYVARPDLISQAFYGTDKYADAICKLNSISNPFELNLDDAILVPGLTFLTEIYTQKQTEGSEVVKYDIDEKVQKISNIASTHSAKKSLTDRRSPNEQTVGDSNYIIDKSVGLIFY